MRAVPKKLRVDAWGADLPEEVRWELYGFSKPPREGDENRPWLKSYEDARGHAAGRGIPPPSRTGWYRFLARMRQEEQVGLICRVQGSCRSAGDLTQEAKITNRTAAAAFRALSVDAAMEGDGTSANLYKEAAARFLDADLKERAQRTRDEQLRLAREKFEAAEKRLAAVKDALTSVRTKGGLTEETLKRIEEAAGLL